MLRPERLKILGFGFINSIPEGHLKCWYFWIFGFSNLEFKDGGLEGARALGDGGD